MTACSVKKLKISAKIMKNQKTRLIAKKAKTYLIIALCVLTILSATKKNAYSQTTKSSTVQTRTDNRIALIQALSRAQNEVVESRKYIAGLEVQVKSKEAIIDAQKAEKNARRCGNRFFAIGSRNFAVENPKRRSRKGFSRQSRQGFAKRFG